MPEDEFIPFKLAIQTAPNQLRPFMSAKIPTEHLQGFLDALARLNVYVPIRFIADGHAISGYTIDRECMRLQGQELVT